MYFMLIKSFRLVKCSFAQWLGWFKYFLTKLLRNIWNKVSELDKIRYILENELFFLFWYRFSKKGPSLLSVIQFSPFQNYILRCWYVTPSLKCNGFFGGSWKGCMLVTARLVYLLQLHIQICNGNFQIMTLLEIKYFKFLVPNLNSCIVILIYWEVGQCK